MGLNVFSPLTSELQPVALVDPSTLQATGTRASVAASIPNGGSVTPAVDLASSALLAFIAPAAWTAAALNIEVSADNSNWVTAGVFDASGVATGQYASLTGGAAYAVDFNALLGYRYVRLRSGTLASPVNQGAQRDFTLITRPLA